MKTFYPYKKQKLQKRAAEPSSGSLLKSRLAGRYRTRAITRPARNSADDNGRDPAYLWVFHGSSSSNGIKDALNLAT
jgi:hypothetical protein